MQIRDISAWMLLIALLPWAPTYANEQKIIRLEQDVRDLERIVQDQARQIEELRRQTGHTSTLPGLRSRSTPAPAASSQWLNAKSWDRIQPGMGELEVLQVLGPPSSMRTGEDEMRVLFYALELGASGFLSGSVTFQDRRVIAVDRPALK